MGKIKIYRGRGPGKDKTLSCRTTNTIPIKRALADINSSNDRRGVHRKRAPSRYGNQPGDYKI